MKLVVCTYTSDFDHPGLVFLRRSLQRWGWPSLRMWGGEGHWLGHLHKLHVLRQAIPLLRRDGVTHVAYLDSWDTVVCGPMAAVAPHLDGGVLISAEMACFPDGQREKEYDVASAKSRWHFVNGGGFMGNIDFLEAELRDIDEPVILGGEVMGLCDQRWLTNKYLMPRNKALAIVPHFHSCFRLDDACSVFQTLAFSGTEDGTHTRFFEVQPDGRIRNKETGTLPVFIHGNSHGHMQWLPGCEDWKPYW